MSLVQYVYVAIAKTANQVSPDDWILEEKTKVFSENNTIKEIHEWASRYQGNDNIIITISD
jgi:hypothetical protein